MIAPGVIMLQEIGLKFGAWRKLVDLSFQLVSLVISK